MPIANPEASPPVVAHENDIDGGQAISPEASLVEKWPLTGCSRWSSWSQHWRSGKLISHKSRIFKIHIPQLVEVVPPLSLQTNFKLQTLFLRGIISRLQQPLTQ
ncbi:hypothetical protein ACH5RR_026127 [Cinchona calisaya]|uniref:Uncharacterized protein n=1 Tax=Cinchona calisaya TaxID=153742 RepID=A0ABD2Z1M8_9GENT